MSISDNFISILGNDLTYDDLRASLEGGLDAGSELNIRLAERGELEVRAGLTLVVEDGEHAIGVNVNELREGQTNQ